VPQIETLRYVRLGVTDLAQSADFAGRVLGLQRVEAPEGLAMFRADSRDPALMLGQGVSDAVAVQVRTEGDMAALCARLTAAGHEVHHGSQADCAERRCRALAWIDLRGTRIELVYRPQDSGWRYFGSRDAGITGFYGVAFASTDVARDVALWVDVLGGRVADWLGDAAYIALDGEHHRIALHPSARDGILEVQFAVEGLHQLMQNKYFMEGAQVPILHGPGRRAVSEQLFLTVKGPDHAMFGLVAEGRAHGGPPRQFPRRAASFCTWGSVSQVPEYGGEG
jgi:2,3-dihydroxy-p-cumate/2,3-dihydroxybenzoate 3,4-dioxygenase